MQMAVAKLANGVELGHILRKNALDAHAPTAWLGEGRAVHALVHTAQAVVKSDITANGFVANHKRPTMPWKRLVLTTVMLSAMASDQNFFVSAHDREQAFHAITGFLGSGASFRESYDQLTRMTQPLWTERGHRTFESWVGLRVKDGRIIDI
jgi:hypothetical protein